MAAIDDAIKTLIKELQKVSGGTTRETTGSVAKPTAKDSEEVRRIQEEINDLYDERLNKDNQSIKNAQAAAKAAEQQLKNFKDTLKENEKLTESKKQQLETLQHAVKQQEEFLRLTRQAEDAASNLADSFAGIFSGADGVSIEKMLNPQAILSAAENMSKMLKAGVGFSEMSKKAAFAFTGAIVKEAIAVADLGVEFQRATGASADFAANIKDSYEEARQFGATVKDVNAAAQSLYTNFTDFSMASDATVKSLTTTGAALNKLGVSNDDFAKSIQLSTKALGMSATQAAANMEDLAGFASDLGVAPSELASQFANAGDMVAKLGSEGTKAFKDLAIAAKVTGMSIDSIVNLTNQFDTFEGAAGMAGKLNAALGGNFVNAMDLMTATNPAERFGMIRDSILDAGLSFDEMSYYQKNFYKESLGLKDVGELAALMSGDMDLVSGAVNQSGDEMIDAKKRAQELATMQERLNMVLVSAIPIITPLVELIESFTAFLTDHINVISPLITILGFLFTAYAVLTTITKAYNIVVGIATGIKTAYLAVTTLLFGAKNAEAAATGASAAADAASIGPKMAAAGATTVAGQAAAISAPQMLAFGFAALMVGGAIAIAALGIAELAKSFVSLNGPQLIAFTGALILFGIGMNTVLGSLGALVGSGVGAAGIGAVLAIGGAAVMMGYGMKLAAEGMAIFIQSLTGLAEVSSSLLMLPTILVGIAASMAAFGNPLTLAGIAMAIPLFLAIGSAATLMSNETVTAFERITKAITAVPTQKNIQFQTSMKTAAAAMTTAAVASTVMAGPAMVAGAITGATGGQKPYNVNITLELDGKELDKRTVKLMNGKASEAAAGRGGAI
jgi:hypothetical protein